MSSGEDQVRVNNGERAVSNDINRAQALAARNHNELLRYLLDVSGSTDDLDAGGVTVEYLTTEAPLRAEIMNGFMVRPQNGVTDIQIDPGVLMMMEPDPGQSGDDSGYKYVRDLGVPANGVLSVAANGGGTTRIDVIECKRDGFGSLVYSTIETDNRDIYNQVTGTFSAATVNKVVGARLAYRVRQGTPGAGMPAHENGWLPLCVASVPAGSVNNDTVTFWDVRPLVTDRVFGISNITNQRPVQSPASMLNASDLTLASGLVRVDYNGRRLGGRLRRGGAGADADTINLTASDVVEPAITFTASRPWYLYLLTPFGLPRWARYKQTGSRVPRSPRGIPVVSRTMPNTEGLPSVAITLPTALGLGGTTSEGACVTAGWCRGGNIQAQVAGDNVGGYLLSTTGVSNIFDRLNNEPIQKTGPTVTITAGAPNHLEVDWTLTGGTDFPPNARALLVEGRADITFTGTVAPLWLLYFGLGPDAYVPGISQRIGQGVSPAVGSWAFGHIAWIDLPVLFGATNYQVAVRFGLVDSGAAWPGDLALVAPTLRILGWKF